jgi:ATP-dependent DNA helicase 2 subunit 1
MHTTDHQRLKIASKWICQATGTLLMPSQMRYYHEYGDSKVFFTKDELAAIKTFGKPGLHLIGFKPQSSLSLLNIKSSFFIYPDETVRLSNSNQI